MDERPGADFSSVAIVGVGLIGGSLALALKEFGATGRVVGISSRKTIEEALGLGAIDEGWEYRDLARALRETKTVFLCTPVSRIIELLPEVANVIAPGTVVSDVGSTKKQIVEQAEKCMPQHSVFIGGHPMAGSERNGVGAADPFLFQNALYVITPSGSVPESVRASFTERIASIGARVYCLSASAHDRVAAAVSHLPQMIALALVEYVGTQNAIEPAHLQMAAGGFRDMTRIASSPYSVWQDILATNASEIRKALRGFAGQLEQVLADIEHMEPHFRAANEIRSSIPRDTKGFLSPLCDVLVRCEDRPGQLARMTAALAREQINIMDIELLKIREGEGGTFRMAFKDIQTADAAIRTLDKEGFPARLR